MLSNLEKSIGKMRSMCNSIKVRVMLPCMRNDLAKKIKVEKYK